MARGGNRSFKGKIKPGDSRRAQQAKRSNAKGGPKGPRGGFASFLGEQSPPPPAYGGVHRSCIQMRIDHRLATVRHAGAKGPLSCVAGAVGAVAAVCIGVLVQQTQRQKQKSASDSLLLGRMRRLPLIITEHADCRMDCR